MESPQNINQPQDNVCTEKNLTRYTPPTKMTPPLSEYGHYIADCPGKIICQNVSVKNCCFYRNKNKPGKYPL